MHADGLLRAGHGVTRCGIGKPPCAEAPGLRSKEDSFAQSA